ncbi:MAG: glutamate-5-semialdehyde dehydrogenase, partial [Candidatus Omnitrophica bacterium]|nr:glutamate-5-semialdehyde dehydrogenase [Candidatus Omnitrophota bacterium]
MIIKEERIIRLAMATKEAAVELASLETSKKNSCLLDMAKNLELAAKEIIDANQKDLKSAAKNKLSSAFIDRLRLDEKRVKAMADSLRVIASLEDPVGQKISTKKRPTGLLIDKVRVPIGVIFIIYESRPNVTSDCVGLCLKAGNAVILRGGSEAINSNIAIYNILNKSCKTFGIPEAAIALIKDTDKQAIEILLAQKDYIDLVMPRGGEELIKFTSEKSRVPVIKHYKGVCHTYVDDEADLNMAEKICFNAKVQRPGVCNAMETLLVHKDIAVRFLPAMIKKFTDAGVEIRGCEKTRSIISAIGGPALGKKEIKAATEKDWNTEYLDLILSVKVVENLKEAVAHIRRYGSMHSDAIVTDNQQNAAYFLKAVDSACVYVNASTRFTDGGEFGMGAEIGISTDKLHARGPMGLEELTTYKYLIY